MTHEKAFPGSPPVYKAAMHRRAFLIGAGGVLLTTGLEAQTRSAFGGDVFRRGVEALEADAQGRLGVAILDTQTGARFAWRGDERFPMCSTFKFVLAAAMLRRVEQRRDSLGRAVPVTAADILGNSPMTETRVGRYATVGELCAATVAQSDNAAANLLLPAVGGPAGLTRFMRRVGDRTTRLDRIEPFLNEARPGDPRDTTTPSAMLDLAHRLTSGTALSPKSREQLVAWMLASVTGDKRLRAGLPAGWRAADKTGANDRGTDNEVAILWPPARKPLLVASYLTNSPLEMAQSNIIHARLGALIAAAVA